MNPICYIRKNVFGLKQATFAKMIGVGQASVSRWEHGGVPTLTEMATIRNAAKARNLPWDDELFYAVPADTQRNQPRQEQEPAAA
jgi:transcriptional regulator with XRE-family HTH domain